MGLFSKRRAKGFDPDLWSDAAERGKANDDKPWFADLGKAGDDPLIDDLETNAGAKFESPDQEWLLDDPGDQIRDRKR